MSRGYEHKIVTDGATLSERLNTLRRPIVMTNGCFDLLHVGHVDYLDAAAQLGETLIVAANSDASIRALEKSPDRPVNTLSDRLIMLAALESVSLVVPFDDVVPNDLIEHVRPDVLVKGGDYSEKEVVGREFVESYGGHVSVIPIRYQRSTSALIARIRQIRNSNET